MAEIRLDSCDLSMKDIDECFSSDVPLVATCRVADVMANEPSLQDESLSPQSREIKAMQIAERKLVRAIEAGARYVDVEIEVQKQMSKRVRNAAHENGTVFIRSYHDFSGTASVEELRAMVEKCRYHGADIVKLVTTANSQEDVDRVMSLYDWCKNEAGNGVEALADGGLIAFCMGEAGKQSRVDCLKYGAPYTYAALSEHEAAAPGQWPRAEMSKAVYGDYKFIDSDTALKMPVSKSFAQRAIIAAALADGVSHLSGYTPCGDNEAALQVARLLGAEVQKDGDKLTIKGISASLSTLAQVYDADGVPSVTEDGKPRLHVGESGLLTRMMIPIMAQLCGDTVAFTGEKTLLGRPLTGAKEIMDVFGVQTANCAPETLRDDKDEASVAPLCVPLTVKGPLKAGRTDISGKHGSQIISGLLMGLPFAERNSTVVVKEPKSIPYMFITLEVLKKFGIKTGNEMLGGRDFLESDGDWSLCTEMVFKVKGGQKYKAADIDLEGDWSAAANFLVAGALFGKVQLKGLDTTSLQADLSIMDILMDAGASLSQTDGDKGLITAERAPLKSFSIDASNCPDLFPIVSVLAAFCQGTSRLAGVGRLANKESDRAKAIIEMLTRMGVKAWVEGDEMFIEGSCLAQRLLNNNLLKGGEYTSHHDHRMVMALKVASLGADSPITIDDEACVGKSFPQFHEIFAQI
jgi:3-phosphoshikimate 1-carboxyvinyltransferase